MSLREMDKGIILNAYTVKDNAIIAYYKDFY
ncbi:MAG: hypothetical protein RLZZ66_1734 [Pseudomonadota bacterium]|jgi:hypothetical protein